MAEKTQIYRPHDGCQLAMVQTNVDVCFAGGVLAAGKTFGAALSTAEPSLDSRWRGLVVKNNIDDLKRGGGVIDTFSKELYGSEAAMRNSDMPRLTFPNGAWIDFCHLADQSYRTIMRRFKSSQYDWIYFDELTEFGWDAFRALLTRNRGKSSYAGKCLATMNPERESWIRDLIDWYIGEDGFIDPDRDGVVRYFYVMGSDVKSVVWGDTKEEVYMQCKAAIDRKLDKVFGYGQGRDKWPNMIKSFTFYLGKMSENKEMLENNEGYIGTVAMSGGAESEKLLEGNWNVSSRDEEECVLKHDEAMRMFMSEPQRNGDKWITVDLADSGTNNFIQWFWDGLHIADVDIAPFTTPRGNAMRAKAFAARHGVGERNIIFDAIRGMYFKDYIEGAVPFESYRAATGLEALQYTNLKECCFAKAIWLIKNMGISIDDEVARTMYVNAASKTSSAITVQNELLEEMRVIRWVDAPSGKKRLMTKKEMNKMLGKGRSMDLFDPLAMRMYPLLGIQNGLELETGRREVSQYAEEERNRETMDIYDDTNWF